MPMTKGNLAILFLGILGALKLVLNAFSIDIITDDNINEIANGLAAIAAVVAAWMNNHRSTNKTDSGEQ